MFFECPKEKKGINFSEAFVDLLDSANKLKIFTKDGNVSIVSRDVVRFFSPLANSIIKDVPCCTDYMVFIPDASKASVDQVLRILCSGATDCIAMSSNQIQEIHETAKMLDLDMTNLEWVGKSTLESSESVLERKEENSFDQKSQEASSVVKQERPYEESLINNVENLLNLEVDYIEAKKAMHIKEETLDKNVENSESAAKPANKSEQDSVAESNKSSSSQKHTQYLHKVKSSKRSSMKSIPEETMAALARMLKDPKRKPTMEEMEDLLSCTKSLKEPVSKIVERESQRAPNWDSVSLKTSRTHSMDRRHREEERLPVSPERMAESNPRGGIGFPGITQPSPVHFPYLPGQPQYAQYQHGGQVGHLQPQPQIQYMVQPGGTVQAYVPGPVPVQYPYSTVQGMDPVQYSMVQAPTSSVKYQVRSPSPVHGRPHSESSSTSDKDKYSMRIGKQFGGTMAEKKARLLTMTLEEKRHMTCLDWNSGLCPRLDSAKICVVGDSNKKHICSKIVKDSKIGGYKVCWGKHREGKHIDYKERETRDGRRENRERRERREDSRRFRS